MIGIRFLGFASIAFAQMCWSGIATAQNHCPDVASLQANATEAGGKTRVGVTLDNRRWLGQRERITAEDWKKMALREVEIHDAALVVCRYSAGEDKGDPLKMMWRYTEEGVSAAQIKEKARLAPKVVPQSGGQWAQGHCTAQAPTDCAFQ